MLRQVARLAPRSFFNRLPLVAAPRVTQTTVAAPTLGTGAGVHADGLRRLLTRHEELVAETERQQVLLLVVFQFIQLHLLKGVLKDLRATEEHLELVDRTLIHLEELFLLVVVGEFNAGKSTFLNALLGQRFLKEGVTPTTARINVLKYGASPTIQSLGGDLEVHRLPVDWLKEINLVDTPGTNAVIAHHSALTRHFVPRSDMVLFVTSADRPFSESEREFMESIRKWGKKVVVVVNKIDLLCEQSQRAEVVDWVAQNAKSIVGHETKVFAVSAREALSAKLATVDDAHSDSTALVTSEDDFPARFADMEQYVLKTLGSGERLRLKFENPLGIMDHLLDLYRQKITTEREALRSDNDTIASVDTTLKKFKQSMALDAEAQIARVVEVSFQVLQRAQAFIDSVVSIRHPLRMMQASSLRADFEHNVVGDLALQTERRVSELIDWLVEKNSSQWSSVVEYVNRRAPQRSENVVGALHVTVDMNRRQSLIDVMGRDSHDVVLTYDKAKQGAELVKTIRSAVLETAGVATTVGGASILGATVFEPSGVLSIASLAIFSLGVIPWRRRRMKTALNDQIHALQDDLRESLRDHIAKEVESFGERTIAMITPFRTAVIEDWERLDATSVKLEEIAVVVAELRGEIVSRDDDAETEENTID